MISPKVTLITEGHPIEPSERYEFITVAPIAIEANVWIGAASTILPGVTIGHDSIIGAGAVVAKDVPPMTVMTGPGYTVRRHLTGIGRRRRRVAADGTSDGADECTLQRGAAGHCPGSFVVRVTQSVGRGALTIVQPVAVPRRQMLRDRQRCRLRRLARASTTTSCGRRPCRAPSGRRRAGTRRRACGTAPPTGRGRRPTGWPYAPPGAARAATGRRPGRWARTWTALG